MTELIKELMLESVKIHTSPKDYEFAADFDAISKGLSGKYNITFSEIEHNDSYPFVYVYVLDAEQEPSDEPFGIISFIDGGDVFSLKRINGDKIGMFGLESSLNDHLVSNYESYRAEWFGDSREVSESVDNPKVITDPNVFVYKGKSPNNFGPDVKSPDDMEKVGLDREDFYSYSEYDESPIIVTNMNADELKTALTAEYELQECEVKSYKVGDDPHKRSVEIFLK